MSMQTLTPKTQSTINTASTIDRAALPKQIAYLVINVTDMAKALDFYKNILGLAVSHESPTWCELSMGVTIALKLADASCSSAASSCSTTKTNVEKTNIEQNLTHRTGLVFNVVNAQKSYDTMKALGIKLQGEPVQGCSEGTLKFSFEDPFGNLFSAYGSK